MRDLNRWKDKVELSLDGRQVFFLFFGSAVVACLVFVTGVLVGKRVEARALSLLPPPIGDPLAALDQLGDVEDEGLTYHRTLTQRTSKRAVESSATKETQREVKVVPVEAVQPQPAGASAMVKRPEAARKGDSVTAHYTLQLSAFPERGDAEKLIHKLQAAGYHPFLAASEVSGKGLFYRVRMGDYTSQKAAVDAKGELERKQRLVAYVAKL